MYFWCNIYVHQYHHFHRESESFFSLIPMLAPPVSSHRGDRPLSLNLSSKSNLPLKNSSLSLPLKTPENHCFRQYSWYPCWLLLSVLTLFHSICPPAAGNSPQNFPSSWKFPLPLPKPSVSPFSLERITKCPSEWAAPVKMSRKEIDPLRNTYFGSVFALHLPEYLEDLIISELRVVWAPSLSTSHILSVLISEVFQSFSTLLLRTIHLCHCHLGISSKLCCSAFHSGRIICQLVILFSSSKALQ